MIVVDDKTLSEFTEQQIKDAIAFYCLFAFQTPYFPREKDETPFDVKA